jgi:hypothetical protein
VYALQVVDSTLFAGTWGGGVFRSTNDGSNWLPANSGLGSSIVWTLARIDSYLFAGTYAAGIFVSTTLGDNWAPVNTGLNSIYVNALLANGHDLYAGTWGGGVFRSSDYGAHWTDVNTGLTDRYVWSFTANANGANVFAGTDTGGVYVTTNRGASWSPVNNGLSDSTVYVLLTNGSQLYAGTWGTGVFVSTNNGINWASRSFGLDSLALYDLSLAVADSNVFVGTSGRGVWRRSLMDILSVDQTVNPALPTAFSLEQNYPNPFNPTTSIKFQVQSSTLVTLKVFDLLGRQAATLVNEQKSAGKYLVQWNAKNFASGVYFYRLTAGSFSATRKLVLLR